MLVFLALQGSAGDPAVPLHSCERTGPLLISCSSASRFEGLEAGVDGQDEAADSCREAGLDIMLPL